MARKQIADQYPTTNRIEAFSDGVFAIVITLLVLELHTPEIKNHGDWAELFFALFNLAPKFLGYVMSFFFVAVFWVAHHQFFHSLNFSRRILLWLNNLFLFFMTFIPFPTAVLGAYYENKTSVIFFGLTFWAASITFAILRWYGWKSNETSDKFDEKSLKNAIRISFLLPTLYAIGIAAAFFSPALAIAVYFLTPILLIRGIKLKTESPHKDDLLV